MLISLSLSQKIDKALLGDIKGMPILTNQARQIQMHWRLTDRTRKKTFLIFKNTKFGHKSSLTQKKEHTPEIA